MYVCQYFIVTVAEVHTPAASCSSDNQFVCPVILELEVSDCTSADQVNAATDTPQTDVTDMTPVQVLVNSVTEIICGFVVRITVTDFELYVTVARAINVQGDQLQHAILRGLRPQLLGHVIQTQPVTVEDLVKAAPVAEAAAAAATSANGSFNQVVAELAANHLAVEQNTAELRRFTTQLSTNMVNLVYRPATLPPQLRANSYLYSAQ